MAEKDLKIHVSQPYVGLNLNSISQQIGQGEVSWAINAVLENFDGNSVTYQNEQANTFCVNPPEGFRVIGNRHIIEKDLIVLWLVNPATEESEIGVVKDCVYSTKINASCLNFDVDHPILKTVVKVTNCSTEVYWTDGKNGRRFIDLDNLPYKEVAGCPPTTSSEIDCNKLSVQPNFLIPQLSIESVESNGVVEAGTYQFAIQYANVLGEGYTSYYSVTNPLSIFDITKITLESVVI